MKKLNILIAIFFSVLMAACASTATTRSTGVTIDDAALTAKVKTSIASDAGLGEALAINVDTYRGEVSLSGFVNNEKQIQEADKVAKNVEGVQKVINNLQVKKAP